MALLTGGGNVQGFGNLGANMQGEVKSHTCHKTVSGRLFLSRVEALGPEKEVGEQISPLVVVVAHNAGLKVIEDKIFINLCHGGTRTE